MNPEERINKPEYKNWIKGTLALIHICEVVRTYAVHIFDKFLDRVPDRDHFKSGSNIQWMAGYCKWDKIKKKWIFTTNLQCPCQYLFKEIINLYYKKGKDAKHIGFENCKARFVGDAWGIAKLFMPVDTYCEAVEKPEDTDVSVVFKMIMNCNLFSHIGHTNIDNIIDGRNDMMHSPQNNLTDSKLAAYIDATIEFLCEAMTPQLDADIRTKLKKQKMKFVRSFSCLTKLAKNDNSRFKNANWLKNSEMTVGVLPEKAERAIQFKKKIIVGSIKRGYEESDVTELSNYLDILEELGGDLLAWNKRNWEMGKQRELGGYREQLERVNQEKEAAEKDLKETKQMLEKAKMEIERTKQELNDTKANLATTIKETEKLRTMLDDTQEQLTLSRKECEMLKQELLDKKQDLTTSKSEIETLHCTIDVIQAQLQQVNNTLTNTVDELTAATNENKILANELQKSESQLKTVQDEKVKICKELRDTQEQLDAANVENYKIAMFLRDVQKQFETAIDDKRNLSKDLDETKDNMLFMLILGSTLFLDNFPLSL